jgi:phage baseplate assembly protein W
MAYKSIEISNANAVVQQPVKTNQFYVGFSSLDPANTTSKLYDLDLIKQDLINQFHTRKGERVMNPTFGSIIWDLIMEPLTADVKEALNADILAICNSDPRVTPTQINLVEKEQGYLLEITLALNGTDQSTNMKLSFDQSVGLSVLQ